jgi:ribosomal protein S18 acetylase RimI-like enzyme
MDLSRAWDFERGMQDRWARTLREFEYGTALYNDTLRRVYDTNFVRFERGFDDLTADLVESCVDELQASLRHRKVMIPDEAAGARVADEMRRRGWGVYALVTMAYRGPRVRPALSSSPVVAEQVDPRAVRGVRAQALDDGKRDAEAREQIVAFTELMAAAADVARLYAAWAAGFIGAFCALFQGDGLGQIDEITTLERWRRRGLGTAVVEAALQAALADGDDVFLVADDGDWPKEWYARLGFEPIGRRWELIRS